MPPLTEEMMEHARDLLLYAVLPALGMALYVMASVTLLRGPAHAPLGAALAVIAAASLWFWLRDSITLISGDSSWNRLPWAALAALWIGRVARMVEFQPSAGWFLRAATAAGIAWLVIPTGTRKEIDWAVPAFAAVVLAIWMILERLATETRGGSVPFCLALCFFAAAVVLIHAQTARLMEAAIMLAAAFAGIAPVAWWRRVDAGGAVPAAAVMLPGLLLMGQQESSVSEIPWYAFALPALAPLLLAEALPCSRFEGFWPRLGRFAWMLLLILVPLVIAVYLVNELAPLTDPEG